MISPNSTPEAVQDNSSGAPSVLAFHKLSTQLTYSVTNYSPHRFEVLLHALTDWRFSFDTGKKGSCKTLLTFDDGYQHLVELLPDLMERFKFTPILFIPTYWIGKKNRWDYSHRLSPENHLSADDIRRLARLGVIFGSHGHRHIDMTAINSAKLTSELTESKNILEDLTGKVCDQLSYPFGRQNRSVRQIAAECGYQSAYTMNFPTKKEEPLALGRYPVYSFDTTLSVYRKLTPGYGRKIEHAKTRISSFLSGGTIILNRMRPSLDTNDETAAS